VKSAWMTGKQQIEVREEDYPAPEAEEAVLAEPLTVAFDLLSRAQIEPFQSVCVSGPGVIGLFCTKLATETGARKVVLIARGFQTKTNNFHFNTLALIASHAIPNWGFPLAFELLSQKTFNSARLVTHSFAFQDIEKAFAVAASHDEAVIKVVITLSRNPHDIRKNKRCPSRRPLVARNGYPVYTNSSLRATQLKLAQTN